MAPEDAPCVHCGAVLPLAQMVRVGEDGEWEYACQGCAVATGTGQAAGRGARRGAAEVPGRRKR